MDTTPAHIMYNQTYQEVLTACDAKDERKIVETLGRFTVACLHMPEPIPREQFAALALALRGAGYASWEDGLQTKLSGSIQNLHDEIRSARGPSFTTQDVALAIVADAIDAYESYAGAEPSADFNSMLFGRALLCNTIGPAIGLYYARLEHDGVKARPDEITAYPLVGLKLGN